MLFSACRPEPDPPVPTSRFEFNSTIEQLDGDNDSKVYLDNERWIYWELGDNISIGSDLTRRDDTVYRATLIDATFDPEYFNGIFMSYLPNDSRYFLGLHPHNPKNRIVSNGGTNFTATIFLPDTQTFRTDGVIDGDITFDKQVYPMVAWYGGEWGDDPATAFNLDFHALGGIVRLNLFNNSGDRTLKSITIRSRNGMHLKGPFLIHDYKIEDPYLSRPSDLGKDSDSILTIYCGEGGRHFGSGDLLTFYVVLPALGGRSVTTTYPLTMMLTDMEGNTFTKRFTVPIRRTGMTNMRAMGVDDWATGSGNGNGSGSAGLSGCGTETRPFKVYDTTDLKYLRDCYNSDDPVRRINGQPITSDTWIAIMRSDIVINDTNWKAGINNFVGHLIDLSHQSNPGITSRSTKPLFQKIAVGGVVEGITLKCGSMITDNTPAGVCTFCDNNAGEIRNCAITSEPGSSRRITSVNTKMAGICRVNSGTIVGCRNDAKMEVQQGNALAGICLDNRGTIKECFVSSEMKAYVTDGAHVAGICLENNSIGTVKDCYFATRVTSTGANDAYWAGIVYTNSGTVEHCYLSSTSHIYTTKDVGGIVAENIGTNSKVDYCWVAGQLRGVNVGGIVKSMASGKVINCFNTNNAMITLTEANSVGGGLVGSMSGGSIDNSYVYDIFMTGPQTSADMGGIVGQATGGSCNNCYSYEGYHTFYGTSSGVTYTRCYIVNGLQDDIHNVTPTAFVTLQGYLNTSQPDGSKNWQGAVNSDGTTSGTPPTLEEYTVTPTP